MTIVHPLRGSLMVHRAVFGGDASVRVFAPPAPAKRPKRDDHHMDGQNRRSDRDETAAKSLHQSEILYRLFWFAVAAAVTGAGKTTTINLFLNSVPPTAGTARINGVDVTQQPLEMKKYLAYIPETVILYKNLTGLENLEYFSALAGRSDYTKPQLHAFLTQVGLQPDAADKRGTLANIDAIAKVSPMPGGTY